MKNEISKTHLGFLLGVLVAGLPSRTSLASLPPGVLLAQPDPVQPTGQSAAAVSVASLVKQVGTGCLIVLAQSVNISCFERIMGQALRYRI